MWRPIHRAIISGRALESTFPQLSGAAGAPSRRRSWRNDGVSEDDVKALVRIAESRKPIPEAESDLSIASSWMLRSGMIDTTVGRVLNATNDPDAALLFFRWAAKQQGFQHTPYSWNALLYSLCRGGRHYEAYAIFRAEMKGQCTPDTFTYSTLLEGFCNAREVEKAEALMGELLEAGFIPHVRAYNNLIMTFFRLGKIDEGMKHFREMPRSCNPNQFTYVTVVQGLCKARRTDEGLQVLDEMVKAGFQPSSFTCNFILRYLCQDRVYKAREFFLAMPSLGCLHNVVSYNTMIHALCANEATLNEAVELFREMSDAGNTPDVIGYTSLISGLCKAGRMEEGYKMLKDMSKMGCQPDTIVFTPFIHGHCNAGEIEKGIQVLDYMLESGCVPDAVVYNILITALCKVSRMDDAHELFRKMTKTGCLPNYTTYSTLADGHCTSGNMDKSYEIYHEMLSQGIQGSLELDVSIMEGLFRAGKVDEGNEILRRIVSNRNTPSIQSFNAAMEGFCKVGRLQEGMELMKRIVEAGCSPDVVTYNTLISGLCSADWMESALKLFEIMAVHSCKPNALTYNSLIEGLYKASRFEEADKLFKEATSKGFAPETQEFAARENENEAEADGGVVTGSVEKGDTHEGVVGSVEGVELDVVSEALEAPSPSEATESGESETVSATSQSPETASRSSGNIA